MRITTPGVYEMTAAEYHADPCPAPSLSASMAGVLLSRSPLHAWHAHPKLNPTWKPSPSSTAQEEGTALHALILEKRDAVVVIDAPNYQKKAAQEARDQARAMGLIPILADRWEELRAVPLAVRRQLGAHQAKAAFTNGRPEVALIWQEETRAGTIWCRSLIDWLPNDPRGFIDDLKTVASSAEPDGWGMTAAKGGVPIQAAFNMRGSSTLRGVPCPGVRFVVVERDAPHALSVCQCGPELIALGRQKMEAAMELWALCLRDNAWSGYPPFVAHIDAPNHVSMQWEERQLREEQIRDWRGSSPLVTQSATPWA
ncbi:PD-(D/E)XK nuclease-like domain-containing protein [Pseudoroseomonas ludipueritiae]